ncbi:Matrix metalloproteinase 1 [Carabus blaptoides fortunei]
MGEYKKYAKMSTNINRRARRKRLLSEVSLSTPSSSKHVQLIPRKLEYSATTPSFLDTNVIAEKGEEHSPRKIIKSLVETTPRQQIDEIKETYGAQFGDIAAKYLIDSLRADDNDNLYGIRKDPDDEQCKIGNKPVNIAHNDIIVDGRIYTGTPGLYELLFKAVPNKQIYTDHDLSNYIEIVNGIEFFDSVAYLNQYGYLTVEANKIMNLHANDTRYIAALELYQRTYRLPINGKLNNETVQLMGELRCGVSDKVLHHTHPHKWINDTLTWKIHHTDPDIINVTKKAFGVWSKHANINFVQAANNSDVNIRISFGRSNHYDYRLKNYCLTRFKGGELGHAFLPSESQSPLKIQIDHTRKWNYELEEPTRHDQSRLLETLVYEIGHTLRIVHTDNENSVSYVSIL